MEPAAVEAVWWVGEQVTDGVRKVPILGDVTSRTTIRTVARAAKQPDGSFVVVEKVCTIDVRTSGGVTLGFDPTFVANVPAATFRYVPGAEGWSVEPWRAGWGDEDVDGNGVAGISVTVDAPICDGSLDIATRSLLRAAVAPDGEAFGGTVAVDIDRTVLGGSNACLRLVPRRTSETVTGTFRFVPAGQPVTCEALDPAAWPVRAPDPAG
jgi:hypothetical protein